MFGHFRTVKIKVPRPCCPWCQGQTEILEERVRALEAMVARLEKRWELEQSLALRTPKIGLFVQCGEAGSTVLKPSQSTFHQLIQQGQ